MSCWAPPRAGDARRFDHRVLLQAAAAALSARPGRTEIVSDRGNFPTDRYVLESLAAERG